MDHTKIDPTLAQALKAFSPQVRRLAMEKVNSYIRAINAGDEATADAIDNEIFQARGPYGKALDAILRCVNGQCFITVPQIDSLIAGATA